MPEELTVKDLAGRLAEVTGIPAPVIARQIRHWAQNGLFENLKVRGEGPTAAVIYSEAHLAAARIYLFFANMCWHVDQIADVSKCLRNIADGDDVREVGDGFCHLWASGLDAVVDAAKRGDRDWVFTVHLTEAGDVEAGAFSRAPHRNEFFESLGRAALTLPIGAMLSPLFKAASAEEQD